MPADLLLIVTLAAAADHVRGHAAGHDVRFIFMVATSQAASCWWLAADDDRFHAHVRHVDAMTFDSMQSLEGRHAAGC